jgi:hypothetical protein
MSTTGGASTSSWSCESPESDLQSEQPQRELADFLTAQCPRYIRLPSMFKSEALFVHKWFTTHLFVPSCHPKSQHIERLFELMSLNFSCATVIGLKLLVVNRNGKEPGRFRLRWSKDDENFSEVFLISVFGLSDHVAVMPTKYLRNRYGDTGNFEGDWEPEQACPSMLAPFMVHYQDLVQFLCDIYEHASTSATGELVNPTYGAVYHDFNPELERLHNILPKAGQWSKVLNIRDLYFACGATKQTLKLSPRGGPGHFTIDGHSVEYQKKSFCRVGQYGAYLRITLRHPLPAKSAWQFLLLDDQQERESICLPRHLVPAHLIGPARHGRHDNLDWPQVEVVARPFVPFMFFIQTPHTTAMALKAILRNNPPQIEDGAGSDARHSIGSADSGYGSSVTRKRSGMEDWILKVLHKEV